MLTRRDWLKLAASTGAASALTPLGGCKTQDPTAQARAAKEAAAVSPVPAPVVTDPDPTIGVRRAMDRGIVDRGWLKARHSFSFASYRDPKWRAFSHLRVINEDTIQPQGGFPLHPHRDMEIITYLLKGELEHKDTLGNGGVIRPGEVQYMSAGSGIRHSEFNATSDKEVHLLQIWLTPNRRSAQPRYASRHFGDERNNELRLIASPDGRDGSIDIVQDTNLYAAVLRSGTELTHGLGPNRNMWLQVAKGSLTLNGHVLQQGDGAYSTEAFGLEMRANEDTEFLLFDLG